MSVVIPTVLMTALMIAGLAVLSTSALDARWDLSEAVHSLLDRSHDGIDTKIVPANPSTIGVVPLQVTLRNEGRTGLGQFSKWDLVLHVQERSGLRATYFTYTRDPSPGPNQWTVKGTYLDAETLTPQIVDPRLLNPGEEMIVLINPDPPLGACAYAKAIFATPNGVLAEALFQGVQGVEDGTVTLNPTDGWNEKNADTLVALGTFPLVETSDDDWLLVEPLGGPPGFFISLQFDQTVPTGCIVSVKVHIEHWEDLGFNSGELIWEIGGGTLSSPTVFSSTIPTVLDGQTNEAVIEWNVTTWIDTPAKANDLKLKMVNNSTNASKKSNVDHVSVVVEYN